MEADTVVLMITIVGLNLTTVGLLMGQIRGVIDVSDINTASP